MKSCMPVFQNGCYMDLEKSEDQRKNYLMVAGQVASASQSFFATYDLDTDEDPTARKRIARFKVPESGMDKLMPTWDAGRNILWYYSKGSLSLSFCEWKPKSRQFKHLAIQRQTKDISGGCFVPQSALNVMDMNVNTFYVMRSDNVICPAVFTVPRRV